MIRASMHLGRFFLAGLLASLAGMALADPPTEEDLDHCSRIENPDARLACYDKLMPRPPARPGEPEQAEPEDVPSLLRDRWGADISDRDSRFDLRPHKANYVLFARYSDSPNTLPTSPTKLPLGTPLDIDRTEAKFQYSFKVKIADFDEMYPGAPPSALWVGYTQQSQWQVYNPGISRPFRETNYEPELMLVFFPDREFLGWHVRLTGLGLNHQSNGRSDPLSRSWNRVYAMVGIEQEHFALIFRPWVRLNEDYRKDDNPDITHYLGYGDITAVYTYGEHTLSLLARYNPASGKGALQAAWNFPLHRRVRGYVQWFTGYGETLIDYNWRQNTIGIGLSLSDVL